MKPAGSLFDGLCDIATAQIAFAFAANSLRDRPDALDRLPLLPQAVMPMLRAKMTAPARILPVFMGVAVVPQRAILITSPAGSIGDGGVLFPSRRTRRPRGARRCSVT